MPVDREGRPGPSTNPLDDASEELLDLIAEALDHGFESIEAVGGPLTPFVILDHGERKELNRLVVPDSAAAIAGGSRLIHDSPDSAERYALAYDGYVWVNGERQDAIIVLAGERTLPHGVSLCQSYVQISPGHPRLDRLGDVQLLGYADALFASTGGAA